MSDIDEFYVGYLPVPPRQLRFVRCLIAVLMIGAVAIGLAIAVGQRDPGLGVWEAESVQTFSGILHLQPYPQLDIPSAEGHSSTVLLVDQGKYGVLDRVRDFDGLQVSIHGQMVERGSLRLIEFADEAEPIKPRLAPSSPTVQPTASTQRVTLQGEIIDPKCHGGAMKPGDGKTHKACAVLCLRGGVPPVFATLNSDGTVRYYLMVDSIGKPLRGEMLEAIIRFVADPVEVTGVTTQVGDQWRIQIDPSDLRRR